MIDFGLAKQYQNPKTEAHIRFRNKKSITGTAAFLSINTHLGMEQSRRDDIESIGYTLLYLATGSLPWQSCVGKDKIEECNKIKEMKMRLSTAVLCKGLPLQFETLFKYCRKLRFTEKPNYQYLQGLFKQTMAVRGYVNNYKYDWVVRSDDNRPRSREEVRARLESYRFRDSGMGAVNVDEEIELGEFQEESDEESEEEFVESAKDEGKVDSAKLLDGKGDSNADKRISKRRQAKNKGLTRREMTTEARVNESKLIYMKVFNPKQYEKLMKTVVSSARSDTQSGNPEHR